MKKILAFICAACIASTAFSQGSSIGGQWIVVGLRGTANSTWLYNANMWNDKGIQYKPSWGGSGGIMLGFHYTAWGSINVEMLYSTFNQKMASKIDSISWTSSKKLSYLEFPILARFDFKNFKYIEAGVKLSTLKTAKESFEMSPATAFDYSNKNAMGNFEKSNMSVVFGWGGALFGSGGLMVRGGFRFTYGLSDIVNINGGKNADYYSLADGAAAKAKSYTKTNTLSGGIHITLDYDLGWVMSSSCNRKYKFFLFKH